MEKKIKFIENIKTFIDRRRDKKPNKDVEDEAEFEGDASDNNPGKVSMNGGSHGTVFGINKKVIMTVIVSGALILGMATYYSASDKKDKEAVKPQQQTQETAANADGVIRNDKNAVGSYEQLLDQPMGRTTKTVRTEIILMPYSPCSLYAQICQYRQYHRLPIRHR